MLWSWTSWLCDWYI